MDSLTLVKTNKKIYNKRIKKSSLQYKDIILLFLLISHLILIYLLINLKISLHKVISDTSKNSNQQNIKIDDIIKQSIKEQKDFCDSPDKYLITEYENMIKLTDFSFKGISYQMYVYSQYDNYMSKEIMTTGKYEPEVMSNFFEVLDYYKRSKSIFNNKDIYMLDIGGNIGAYPSFLGKIGYSIISFEASPRNYYVLKKNYCHINKNANNIVIINRAISNEEKICNYYTQLEGIGNGMLLCDEEKENLMVDGYHWKKKFEVRVMKLSDFIPYISDKNLALVKLDIEGSEGQAIKNGIELVNKYHIPYIFSEFSPGMLKKHGTEPKEFLESFTNNGYKISLKGFLNESYISLDEAITNNRNLYFIYKGKP